MKPAYIFPILAVIAAIAAFFVFKHPATAPSAAAPAQAIVEQPRTEAPMEQFTRFFQKKLFDIDDGKQKRSMTYYWFAPEKPYPPGLKFPLVLVLHGSPGNAYAAEYLIARQMQMDFPAFVLAPASPFGKKWAAPEKFSGQEFGDKTPVNYVWHPELESLPDAVALIRQLETEFPVDTHRIYVMGCSDGGTGTFGAVLRYPDMFAGAAAISGAWSFLDAAKMTHVPLWIIHGTQDPIMPVSIARGISQIIKQQRGPVFYTEISTMGHECPSAALYGKPLWQWLFSQRKP